MSVWRIFFLASCFGIALYLNRTLSLDLGVTEQLISVLLGVALLLVCVISMFSVYTTRVTDNRKSSIVIGWLITFVFAFEMVGSVINFKLRVDIAEGLQNTKFASVTYDPQGLLILDGQIGAETATSLTKLLSVYGKKPLVMNSGGGSLQAASEMAATVRDNELTVIVATECSSACVLVAIASDNLLALPESKFGFHQGSIFGANRSDMAQFWANSANDSLMLALKRGGIPESILAIARRTPPEDMYYVSAAQMKSFGIVTNILE